MRKDMASSKSENEILTRLDVLVVHLEGTMKELKTSTLDNTKRIGDVENQQMRISEQLVQATTLIKENSNSMMDISEKFSTLITELQRDQINELKPIQDFISKQGEKNRFNRNLLYGAGSIFLGLMATFGLIIRNYVQNIAIEAVELRSVKFNRMEGEINTINERIEFINKFLQPQ
jgi:Mg2+ and Co2+ transporter CorA